MKYQIQGLSSQEVTNSRKTNGDNTISQQVSESFWKKLLDNFQDPIIIILCVALVVILFLSFFHLTEWYEAVAIGFAVLLATLVSTFSEYQNESSFQKLQEEASQTKCHVFRNGEMVDILVDEVVKGDKLLLQSGDKIPADGVVVEGKLKVSQAALTGESEALHKEAVNSIEEAGENDFSNTHRIFRGATIEDGEAVMEVTAVGGKTFYGELAEELSVAGGGASPLQLKLTELAKLISKFGYWGAGLIAIAFLFNKAVIAQNFDPASIQEYFSQWQNLLTDSLNAGVLAIIIIVAAVPEGLPMMIAIVLSKNMRKMLKSKVLVRKLLGIETAGSINLLFSDKTGTLTKGELEAKLFIDSDGQVFDGYEAIPEALRAQVRRTLVENSYSVLSPENEPIGGNSSEKALISFIAKEERKMDEAIASKVVGNIRFNSTRKFSATEVVLPDGSVQMLIKGATEVVLKNCQEAYHADGHKEAMSDDQQKELLLQADKLADKGIRLIALATATESIGEEEQMPEKLALVGIVGIRDEIRPDAQKAIKEAHHAGIQVVMITGDRKGTALAIAQEIGLIEIGEEAIILTSQELQQKSDKELEDLLPKLRVVARALPTDKSRLVRIAQGLGKVVGMTGDGVNDAPALKQADVGFGMGSGSEVAKEASDIVILDDNFASIANAVRYGRTIYHSIQKFIVFQLTVNLAAVLTALLAPLFGVDFPLTIIQILWINIVMDTLAALAFGGEPALRRYMDELPVAKEANILNPQMKQAILFGGLYITALAMVFLNVPLFKEYFLRDGVYNEAAFLTGFFNLFLFLIAFNSFNARTEKTNLFEHLSDNKGFLEIIGLIFGLQILFTYLGGEVLRTVPLQWPEWLLVTLMAVSIIPIDWLRKKL